MSKLFRLQNSEKMEKENMNFFSAEVKTFHCEKLHSIRDRLSELHIPDIIRANNK
jgi:hypothetical protein